MTTDPQALNFTTSTTSFNGKKVVASNQSAVLSLSANELVTATVSSQSVPITLAGVNISNAYTNGVAAVAATTSAGSAGSEDEFQLVQFHRVFTAKNTRVTLQCICCVLFHTPLI